MIPRFIIHPDGSILDTMAKKITIDEQHIYEIFKSATDALREGIEQNALNAARWQAREELQSLIGEEVRRRIREIIKEEVVVHVTTKPA